MYIVLSLFRLGSILPSLAAAVRRLRHRTKWVVGLNGMDSSDFYDCQVILFEMPDMQIFAILLTVFAAISGLATGIILIIWLASDGQFGPNKYGPNPKRRNSIGQGSSDNSPRHTFALISGDRMNAKVRWHKTEEAAHSNESPHKGE